MRLVIIGFTIFSFILLSLSAKAHDFWLSPEQFASEQDKDVNVKFLVGHAGHVDSWSLTWDRVVALRTYHEDGFQDQLANIIPYNMFTDGFANVKIDKVGTHVLGFESYHAFSSLEGEKFNSYAKNEGLNLVLEARKREGLQDKDGREIYSRKAKALIQVGEKFTDNVTKPIGHMLEIVPLQHPYKLEGENSLSVQVLFRGKALENAQIDLESLVGENIETIVKRTDENGVTSFNITKEGSWKLNTVWSVPLLGKDEAEFETYFSSLTFGF